MNFIKIKTKSVIFSVSVKGHLNCFLAFFFKFKIYLYRFVFIYLLEITTY